MKKQVTEVNRTAMVLVLCFVGLALIFLGIILSISYGTREVAGIDIIQGLFAREKMNIEQLIIWDYRFPRAISAVLIGCFLATSGAMMQGITRNSLASPSIMGVNQGAVLAMAIYMSSQAIPATIVRVFFAFIGAAISAVFIFLLSLRRANLDITRMLLAGSALGALFLSLASMVALLTGNSKDLAFWMAGGFGSVNWSTVYLLLGASIILPFALTLSPKIMIVSLGDEVAIGLGEKPNLIRFLAFICIVLLSGVAISVGGNIGFICLIVPHIARMGVGVDYRYVIPISMVFGGVLLVFSDVIARVIGNTGEIPVGSITSLIGVPVLIYLVRREKRT